MDGMDHEPEDDDDAARAFEALREEVAVLRRGVELVYRQGQQSAAAAPGAPDYSPTLGKMERRCGPSPVGWRRWNASRR